MLLVDCLGNDGAVVDSISIVANEASTTASKVLVFLSIAGSAASITSANTVCVANATISLRARQVTGQMYLSTAKRSSPQSCFTSRNSCCIPL